MNPFKCFRWLPALVLGVLPALAGSGRLPAGEWRSYGGDAGHTKYSPLDQIRPENVRKLSVAWT